MSTLYATFLVAGHCLAVDVLEVQEVLSEQRLTSVPLAPEIVEGLINLRGQIVPALDLRRVLKLAPSNTGQQRFSVVARSPHGLVSLQVDEIGDVMDLDVSGFEPPPDNLDPAIRSLLRGVYKLKARLLLVLDTTRATEIVPAAKVAANRSHDDAKTE
jgi:purine-binding chemotaxis protein CheW